RSSRMLSISRPTLPVAPTTATLKPIKLSGKRWFAPASRGKTLITQRCTTAAIYDFLAGNPSVDVIGNLTTSCPAMTDAGTEPKKAAARAGWPPELHGWETTKSVGG